MRDLTLGTECGGFTYTLEYISGPISNPSIPAGADLSLYTDLGGVFSGIVETFDWVGTHLLRLKCTNGNRDNFSMRNRGTQGLFNSVYSQPIELIIEDPCEFTRVNPVLVNDMFMPFGQTMLTSQISGPSNIASLDYGNGFDKCGPLEYSIIGPSGVRVFQRPWLSLESDIISSQSDKIYINLLSEPDGPQ